jgi:hypothetical protein
MRARTCKAVERRLEGPERSTAEIAGQHADVIAHVGNEHGQALHRAGIHVDMHVADVEHSEAVEGSGQPSARNGIVADHRVLGVSPSPPIEARHPQGIPNDGVDGVPILDVEEVEAVTERLRFVVGLDAEPLSRVQRSQTPLQPAGDISHNVSWWRLRSVWTIDWASPISRCVFLGATLVSTLVHAIAH